MWRLNRRDKHWGNELEFDGNMWHELWL